MEDEMRIVIVSAFRNMSTRITGYFRQVHALDEHIGPAHSVRVVAVQGDSYDETELELAHMAELWQIPTEIITHEHGCKVFGSTEEPARLEALTGVMIAGMKAVQKTDDIMLYVESDLLWQPHQVGSIIDMADRRDEELDVIAPLCMAGEAFYDIWGMRGLDGERFSPFVPYHADTAGKHDGLVEVESVGSCFAVRAAAASKVKPIGTEGLRSWCRGARKAKLRIGVALAFHVNHPA
jgi:hypothetical protein